MTHRPASVGWAWWNRRESGRDRLRCWEASCQLQLSSTVRRDNPQSRCVPLSIRPTTKEKLSPPLDRLVRSAGRLVVIDRDTISIHDLLMPLDTVRGQATDTLKLPPKLLLAHRSIVYQNTCSVKREAAKVLRGDSMSRNTRSKYCDSTTPRLQIPRRVLGHMVSRPIRAHLQSRSAWGWWCLSRAAACPHTERFLQTGSRDRHKGGGQGIPCQPLQRAKPSGSEQDVSRPVLGGLHHDYRWRADARPSYARAA